MKLHRPVSPSLELPLHFQDKVETGIVQCLLYDRNCSCKLSLQGIYKPPWYHWDVLLSQ